MRVLKRTVCIILAFLMLTGSVEPVSLLPVSRAESLEASSASSVDVQAETSASSSSGDAEAETSAASSSGDEQEEPSASTSSGDASSSERSDEKEPAPSDDQPEGKGEEAGEKEAESAPEQSAEAEEEPDASSEAEEEPDASEETPDQREQAKTPGEAPSALAPQTATGTVKLTGVVEYVDEPFTELIRPEGNPTLVVVPIYKNEQGEFTDANVKWSTQGDDSSQQGYIFFFPPTSDNYLDGAVAFDIYNLPRTVTVDGVEKDVVKYRVEPVFSDPVYYYH